MIFNKLKGLILAILFIALSPFSFADEQQNELNMLVDKVFEIADDNPEETIALANKAFQILNKTSNDELEVRLIAKLAWVYARIGELDKAKSLADSGIEKASNLEDAAQALGDINNLLGSIAWYEGSFSQAIEYFFESLKFRNQVGDKEHIAASLNNIGAAYQEIYEYSNALEYHQKSLRVKEDIGHQLGIATSLSNIAVVYFKMGNNADAKLAAEQSLALFIFLDKPASIAELRIQLAEIAIKQSQLEIAYDYIELALATTEKNNNKALTIRALISKANYYLLTNDLSNGLSIAKKAFEQATELKLQDKKQDAYLVLSKLYQAQGNFEQSLSAYQAYHQIYLATDKNKLVSRISALEEQIKEAEITKALALSEQQNNHKDVLILQSERKAQIVKVALTLVTVLVLIILLLYFRLYQKNKATYLTSITDQLCQCFSRSYLFNELAEGLYHNPQRTSLLLIDIDFFKKVNDTYGHQGGDAVLKAVSQVLNASIGEHGTLVRLGGEEFVIVLAEHCCPKTYAEQLQSALAEKEILVGTNAKLNITCSVGISQKVIANPDDLSCLISEADSAMYQAKEQGRNQIVNFNEMKDAVHLISNKIR